MPKDVKERKLRSTSPELSEEKSKDVMVAITQRGGGRVIPDAKSKLVRRDHSVEPVRTHERVPCGSKSSKFTDAGTQADDSDSDEERRGRTVTDSSDIDTDKNTVEVAAQAAIVKEWEPMDNKTETIEVNQLVSVSKYRVTVIVGGTPVDAIVDTGADVTIISEEVFDKMVCKPKLIRRVILNAAGKKMRMSGRVVGPVKLKIGSKTYEENIHVAPISQDMLLGFNFLQGRTVLDFVKGMFEIDGEGIAMKADEGPGELHVARVTVSKRCVVPPNSVKHVKCELDREIQDFVVEADEDLEVMVPKTLHKKGKEAIICVVNVSDRYRVLKRGREVANAFPVEDVIPMEGEVERATEEVLDGPSTDPTTNTKSNKNKRIVPVHLKKTYEDSCQNLTPEQRGKLADILIEYEDVFAKSEFDLGTFTDIEHSINTGDSKPVKQRLRRTPACFADEEETHLKKMVDAGVIQESVSEWASAPVLIRKRDKSVRYCIDYRALNSVTVKDTFPLPLVDDCLDTLAGNTWFSKLDANSAYWQVNIKESDRHKTAFTTKYGLYEHVKMGFGLCNAPATFSRVINLVFRGLNWKTVLAFLDDILVLGKSFDQHLDYLSEALERFRKFGLKLKPKKCAFFQHKVEFLGRIISDNKLAMAEADINTVRHWPTPGNAKDVQRFLGLANYHRTFVPNFAELCADLYDVTGKYKFQWGEKQQIAFNKLRLALTSPPVLALPNHQDEFVLDTDASNIAVSGELIQIQSGEEKVVAYGSYVLTPEQRNYCVTRRELLAVVRFTRQYRHYLLGRPFTLRTDHSSLTWLMNFKEPQGQLARWMEELSQYNIILKHRAGKRHGNADSLSRPPMPDQVCSQYIMGANLEDLPCFASGCHYCRKAHENWARFTADVDEAIPLGGIVERGRITMCESANLLDKEDVATREVQRCTSEDISGVRHRVRPMDLTKQEGPKYLQRKSEAQIIDGEIVAEVPDADVIGDPENITGVNFTVGGSEWDKSCENPSCDSSLSRSVERDIKDCGETAIEVVLVGEEYEVFGIEAKTCSEPSKPSSWGFSIEELVKEQAKDPDLELLLDWLKTGVEPEQKVLYLGNTATKAYWINREAFEIIQGVIYVLGEDGEKKLVIPASLKEEALRVVHDIPSAAHQGVKRTKARAKEKFFWHTLSDDVSKFVRSCEACNRNKKSDKHGKCPLTEFQVGSPMERIHIDFLGPLPRTTRGNEHVLMMVDQFTKWVECVPLPSQTAEVTARAAVNTFFSRFGCPLQIHSDQGRNFEGKLFAALCEALEIHKTRTTPYRPSSNGQVERFNRTLMNAVRCYIEGKQKDWDLHIPQIAGALRASVNRSTGFSANKLMLGREVNMPAALVFPVARKEGVTPEGYVEQLQQDIAEAHQMARNQLKTSIKRMKRNYDLRIMTRAYEEGDAVYVLDTATIKGKCKKLSPPWKGPGVIAKKISAYLFRVKLRNAVCVMNHDRLKPCRDRQLPKWIMNWKTNPQVDDTSSDSEKYCFCRQTWNERFMIACDYCDEWYHGSCVNISPTEALQIAKYKCRRCRGEAWPNTDQ